MPRLPLAHETQLLTPDAELQVRAHIPQAPDHAMTPGCALEAAGSPSPQGPGAPGAGSPHAHRVERPGAAGGRVGAPGQIRPRQPRARRAEAHAASGRGANFYTYFLFRFGCGVALAPPRIRDPDTDFPPPGDVASLAPRSPTVVSEN